MGFFRYPGGKGKVAKLIIERINSGRIGNYREPFFGGGSIGLSLLEHSPPESIWINDGDIGVSCLWSSVIRFPEELKSHIRDFRPSVEAFDQFKESLLSLKFKEGDGKEKVVRVGFEKLAIHQISYSGLGTKSGGPLGGREQKSKYPIDCRWSPDYICKKIDKTHKLFARTKVKHNSCTPRSFLALLGDDEPNFAYLDPPYYIKGGDLYQKSFSEEDHELLSEGLRARKYPWLLSYDDHPRIRELYEWANIEEIDMNYTITATKDRETGERKSRSKTELLIFPK